MNNNKELVKNAFEARAQGNSQPFHDLLAENIKWTISGSSVASKTYYGKEELINDVFKAFSNRFVEKMLPVIDQVIADENIVVVEWHGDAMGKNGKPYNQKYCWVLHMENEKIRAGTAYLDTILVNRLFES